MEARSGKVNAEDVAEAKRIYEALRDYKIPEPSDEKDETPAPKPEILLPKMAQDEFKDVLEDLTMQRHEAHRQMCLLSNTLADYPDDVNVKGVVDEIEAFKQQRNALGEKIDYLKANHRLPAETQTHTPLFSDEAQTVYLDNLPVDRYELNKLLKDSLMPMLSKARKNATKAKTDVKRLQYEQKAVKLELEIKIARSKLASMS
ncbi:hypothetical protein QE357_002233 [Siphonobacter sp. BAB-5404]|nr:hypothetical protein [Siphonobacter sp. SORGH_AS_0500]